MAKRRVPAALHRELTEYAALLRALRVRDAMDLTKHLTRANPFALPPQLDDDVELNSDDDLDDDELLDGSHSHVPYPPSTIASESRPGTPVAGPSNLKSTVRPTSAKAKGKQKAKEPAAPKQRRRDHWTRWPLPLEDVLNPEWTLEDEVAVIVSQLMKMRPRPPFPVPVAGPDEAMEEDEEDRAFTVADIEFDEEDPDPPFYVPYIVSIIANYLSTILGLLASFTPARPASMQNRIEPLNWRAIIDVVVSCGIPEFANAKYVASLSRYVVVGNPCCRVVNNVIKRMEAIYGPSVSPLEGKKATSYRAVERIKEKEAATKKFEKKFDEVLEKYWQPVSPRSLDDPSPTPSLPLKRKPSAKERKDEAEFRVRSRSAPAEKKRKPRAKAPLKEPEQERNSAPTAATQNAEAGPSSRKGKGKEEQAPVRRSGRARNNVNYREVLLDNDIIMGE
ncbi:hypothetical protein BDZ97DRAFT_2075072 [Flammula alnicola]|nr:hypothetical protein BDZ97DRAFT_2075072 [Flammula alnicola]